MRLLLLSIIFILLVKFEYMDRELSSLIIDRDNVLLINKSNTESLKLLVDQNKDSNNLLLQREKRREKQQGELLVTTESLRKLLYEKEQFNTYWPDDVLDWLQHPY
ncbi:hypothetical protein UB37_05120 [Photobacterium iliopiscarium]|uniref:Uncharacterized protein n=1 Tax=Photobacterium iliopiscarium TaxID=56192 RepID=A0A0D8Q2J5_9GAMM|nr:hypothetical protein [Photobacterium iliopiscarium]KJG14520.1 hypothetical protein UB38_02675 [Photobacterium iliopiscarium]KJG24412.1 hypothetical protein UB37_05120 [Photobacterium iliopiscarium]PST95763.1 hypothetical protein C9I87_06620 [Photobacterium iliopiscarium]PST99273.1 hypothetical protein C9I85_12065 [Photobacterium iliopiscarium]PSV84953.1 hypothetical protein C9J51_01345 [Photobacterium iliopiscarium]